MSETNKLDFSVEVVLYPLALVLLMWIVFWAEIRFNWDFTFLGIGLAFDGEGKGYSTQNFR